MLYSLGVGYEVGVGGGESIKIRGLEKLDDFKINASNGVVILVLLEIGIEMYNEGRKGIVL